MKRAVVFSGGTINSYVDFPIEIYKDDLVICADSGINHCIQMDIIPNILVGDFDSSDFESALKLSFLKDTKIIKLSPCKDDTDTEHALHLAIDMGATEVVIVGGFGGRVDHMLANIFLAETAYKNNVKLTVADEKNILHYLKNGTICFEKSRFKYISIIPLEDSVVSCSGLLYPLNKEKIKFGTARGVSNELVDKDGFITLHEGCAFVVESKD